MKIPAFSVTRVLPETDVSCEFGLPEQTIIDLAQLYSIRVLGKGSTIFHTGLRFKIPPAPSAVIHCAGEGLSSRQDVLT